MKAQLHGPLGFLLVCWGTLVVSAVGATRGIDWMVYASVALVTTAALAWGGKPW